MHIYNSYRSVFQFPVGSTPVPFSFYVLLSYSRLHPTERLYPYSPILRSRMKNRRKKRNFTLHYSNKLILSSTSQLLTSSQNFINKISYTLRWLIFSVVTVFQNLFTNYNLVFKYHRRPKLIGPRSSLFRQLT